MARIGIDCRFASLNVGLGTYTRQIVSNLITKDDANDYVLFVRSTDEPWIADLKSANYKLQTTDFAHYSLKEQVLFPKIIKKSGIDLLYSPHFNVPYFCPVPFVATIHDLILHRFPNNASLIKRIAYRIVINRAVSRAAHLIAVSEFTKKEMESEFRSQVSDKTTVVTEGYDESFRQTQDKEILDFYDLEPGYFLYVGTAKQHKNVQILIDAHKKSGTEIPLIIVTNGKEVDRLRAHDGVRILLGVETEELSALYSSAGCFVTASAYEGFCLPLLEARACGCPVIAANTSAIPEVAGANAVLCKPILESLSDALRSPPTKFDSPEQRYNWGKSAQQISAILTTSCMDRISHLIPRVLGKRGLKGEASASYITYIAMQWIERNLPSHMKNLSVSKLRDNTLIIESHHPIASQELSQVSEELKANINDHEGVNIDGIMISRSRSEAN